MKWLDIESVRLPERAKIFTVSRQDQVNYRETLDAMTKYRDEPKPEALEAFLHCLVVRMRPELAGCTLWFMSYDMRVQAWEIGVSHSSLPIVSLGEEPQREPLVQSPKPNVLLCFPHQVETAKKILGWD